MGKNQDMYNTSIWIAENRSPEIIINEKKREEKEKYYKMINDVGI